MKKILLMIAISAGTLVSFGEKTYVRMKEDVNVRFINKIATLYKNEILEKNVEGKLLFFGELLEVTPDKTVNVSFTEMDTVLDRSINSLVKNDSYYKISKDGDGKIILEIDVTNERNNIPAIIIYPLRGEKINLKTDNKIERGFEDFSYKYIRVSAADENKKICISTVFVDPGIFNLFTKDTIEFVDGKANINSKINLKWKDLLTIENQVGVSYNKESKDISLDFDKLKELKLTGIVQGTDLRLSAVIKDTKTGGEMEVSGERGKPRKLNYVNIIIYVLVCSILIFGYYLIFFRKHKKKMNEPTTPGPYDDLSGNITEKQTDIEIDENLKSKINDLSTSATKQELSTPSSKADILKLSENVDDLKVVINKLQQDINKSGGTFKLENIKLKKEIEIKEIETSKLQKEINEYKENEIKHQMELSDFQIKLASSTPKGIVYLGDCSAFIQPNERFMHSLIECEKSLLSYIDSVKISSDAAILKGMAGKFYMARPSKGITEWMSILENLKMNGMMVHSIKNDLVKEKDKSVIIEILNHKLYEGVYKKYLGALILFIEEIRTANIVGVSSKPSIDLKAKIFEICTGAKSIGCKVVYLPLFETISDQDFNNINTEEDSKLAANYLQYSNDTVIEVISYAVNREPDSTSKSKVVLK